MENRIKQICEHNNHFWYPEIKKNINHILKNPLDSVKLDLNVLYDKKANTIGNRITVFVSKIFHRLCLFFSKKYRTDFAASITILASSEKILRASITLQKASQRFLHKQSLRKLAERKEKENKAATIIQKTFRRHLSHKHFLPLRENFLCLKDIIHKAEPCLKNENKIVELLTQYQACLVTTQDLDKKKPNRVVTFLKGDKNKELRKSTLDKLIVLEKEVQNNSLISDDLKDTIKAPQKTQNVLKEIINEKNKHEAQINEYANAIKNAKADIHRLIPA